FHRTLADGTVRYRSELFALLYSPATERCLAAGFVQGFRQAARIHAEIPPDGSAITLRCVTYPHGAVPDAAAPLCSEPLFLAEAPTPEEALERYLQRLHEHSGGIPARPLTGWSDWQYYRRSKTEAHLLSEAAALKAGAFPVEYIMLDDGFQKSFGDWLEKNDKFEHDVGWVARHMKESGFAPGIWIAPLTAALDSGLAKAHPEWLLKGPGGAILVRDSHMGKIAPLDFTHPGALAWLEDLVRKLVHDHGYRWVKLDGPILRYVEHGVFHERGATPVSMIRRALEVIRRAAGPDVIIEGEGYYGPAFGLVDTQRVTQDIQPEWARLKDTARDNLASLHFHGRFWANNPDAYILRDTPSPYRDMPEEEHVLTRDELELEITALALTGGVAMLTDRMDILKPERAALIDAFLPPHVEAARPLPGELMRCPYPERFILEVRKPWGRWWIGACFNWGERARTFAFPVPKEAKKPVVVDFWKRKLLSAKKRLLRVRVAPHGVRLFSIRETPETPGLVGLTRHFTQGGMEVTRCGSSQRRFELEIAASRAPAAAFIHTAGKKVASLILPEGARSAVRRRVLRISLPPGGPHAIALTWMGR
ncbi:MAG TPA: alpha-galactosidase, partial [Planctomycetes bacterium]|nr:alpha-galactosidase [Planctomycetota bacterium]